jgi:hypothetical protein
MLNFARILKASPCDAAVFSYRIEKENFAL